MKYGIRKIIVTKAVGVTCDEGCCGGKDWGLREAVSEDSYEEKEKEKDGRKSDRIYRWDLYRERYRS